MVGGAGLVGLVTAHAVGVEGTHGDCVELVDSDLAGARASELTDGAPLEEGVSEVEGDVGDGGGGGEAESQEGADLVDEDRAVGGVGHAHGGNIRGEVAGQGSE